jgi:hypothetical protein
VVRARGCEANDVGSAIAPFGDPNGARDAMDAGIG